MRAATASRAGVRWHHGEEIVGLITGARPGDYTADQQGATA